MQKVLEALAQVEARLARNEQRISANAESMDEFSQVLRGVGALLRDCVVKREEHLSGLL